MSNVISLFSDDKEWKEIKNSIDKSLCKISMIRYLLTVYRRKEWAMDDLVHTQDWFRIRNIIRKLEKMLKNK